MTVFLTPKKLGMVCVLAATGLALTACGSTPPPHTSTELPPEPTARVEDHSIELFFATDRAELTPEQTAKLAAFMAPFSPDQSSVIVIEGHADYRASADYNLDLSARRVATVRARIEELGFERARIETIANGEHYASQPPVSEAAMARDRRASVVVTVYASVAPPCPDWSRPIAYDPQNLPSSNFGCATASNLAAMIADPRDLIEGERAGPNDGSQAVDAIERYRTDEVKELSKELASE